MQAKHFSNMDEFRAFLDQNEGKLEIQDLIVLYNEVAAAPKAEEAPAVEAAPVEAPKAEETAAPEPVAEEVPNKE